MNYLVIQYAIMVNGEVVKFNTYNDVSIARF